MNYHSINLGYFGHLLVVEYNFPGLWLVKQLLLDSKSVPYYPKVSLTTPKHGTVIYEEIIDLCFPVFHVYANVL